MNTIIKKITDLEKKISEEKGDFILFAFIERMDLLNKWDLVISAEWLNPNKKESYDYIAKEISKHFNKDEFSTLSRIVLLNPNDYFVHSITFILQGEHLVNARISNINLNDVPIKDAFIITSQKPLSSN